jgi:hypothetical protein
LWQHDEQLGEHERNAIGDREFGGHTVRDARTLTNRRTTAQLRGHRQHAHRP